MVIFLLLYPIIVAAGLFALDAALPIELVNIMAGSFVFTAVLSLFVLTAVLVAAYRKRDNPVLMSAWLFLFCGLAVLSLSSLIDPFLSGSQSWAEELFSTASFFPLMFFSLYIASPMRLVIFSRRQRALYLVAGIVALLAVFAIVFLPWLLMYEGPRLHASTKHLLRLAKPVLDTLLAEPLALLVLVIGLTSGSGPYLLIGVGLLFLIPEDILEHFQLLQKLDPHGQLSNLISITSRLYLLNGAMLGIFKR
ncbi:MAG: hypothetical protein ABSB63_13220 [Spirochaetia bacterium]|jgi:hypothetical protein